MEQIERIRRMEQLFDLAKEAMEELVITLEKYKELQKAIAVLSEYYGSKDWKQDYADDEAGLLPKDLKRGVLSEDGLWNLLADWKGLISDTALSPPHIRIGDKAVRWRHVG